MIIRTRLTVALVLAIHPQAREYAVHHTVLQRFILRIRSNGEPWSSVFRYRRESKPRRVMLGKPDAVEAN